MRIRALSHDNLRFVSELYQLNENTGAPVKDPKTVPKTKPKPRIKPWNPPKPKEAPKPKAKKKVYEEGFRDSANPNTVDFWSNIRQSDHPYSKHPLMAMYGLEKAEKSYDRSVATMKKIFPQLANADDKKILDNIMPLAQKALMDLMRIEAPFHEQLKEIAVDVVHEVWEIPKEMMNAKFQMTPGMKSKSDSREDYYDENDYEASKGGFSDDVDLGSYQTDRETDEDALERLRPQINKRITMNALTQGAAVQNMASIHHMVKDRIEELSPELMDIYDRFSSTSTSAYWLFDFANMPGLENMAIGSAEVKYQKDPNVETRDNLDGNGDLGEMDDEVPVVHAQAMVFPVLVQELVKGAMEVLSLHGLSDLNEKDLQTVYKHADKTSDEPWLIQVGPHLWNAFLKIVPRGYGLADIVANIAAKEPEFIHDLLSKTIEAYHDSQDPVEQREALQAMMDEIREIDDLL